MAGVSVYNKDNSKYFKVHLTETTEDGKVENTILSFSISNTGARNNRHVIALLTALNQVKPGDNVEISAWMAKATDKDGKPVLSKSGNEIYNATAAVKKDGELVTTAGKQFITKETFAEDRKALESNSRLKKEQVDSIILSNEVDRIMEFAEKLAAKMPAYKKEHASAEAEASAGAEKESEQQPPFVEDSESESPSATPDDIAGADW